MIIHEEKRTQLNLLQKAVQHRTDFTLESLLKSHQVQLEILAALKTGIPDFLQQSTNIPSSDLAEILMNTKCRNPACRSPIPVDKCGCKVCLQKNGFCSNCMCLLCSKFDMASNTFSWVGCDVCVHWCHTDCGLRQSFIRSGRSVTGGNGATEMQFHCVACDHPSEMFGFVKEVFKTCAKEWKAETFSKELEYVKRIFAASKDMRGRTLHEIATHMLLRLEIQSSLPEVYNLVMGFLAVRSSSTSTSPSTALLAMQNWSRSQLAKLLSPNPEPPIHEMFFLVTEFSLPGMSCYEFIRRIREIPCSKYIKIMVIDSVYDPTRYERCQKEGVVYVRKPIETFKIESLKVDFVRGCIEEQQTMEEVFSTIIVISPKSDPELIDAGISYFLKKFSYVNTFIEASGTSAINTIEELGQPTLIKERLVVITEFDLTDMSCYDLLKRIKQIPFSGYKHVAVVDPDFQISKKLRFKQDGAEYYMNPIDASQLEFFKIDILRKERKAH